MKINFIENLKLSGKLTVIITVFIIGFLIFGGYSLYNLSIIKVNGPVYNQIIMQKDLLADVLPPPEYIIESYLTVLQLCIEDDSVEIDKLIKKGDVLKKDFEERHAYWVKSLAEGTGKNLLIKEAYDSAIKFYDIRDNEFIPAILQKDRKRFEYQLHHVLEPIYEKHRATIDKIVETANADSKNIEIKAKKIENRTNILLIVVAGVIILIVLLIAVYITKIITISLNVSKKYLGLVSKGDFREKIPVEHTITKDEFGEINKAIEVLQVTLKDMVTQISEASDQVAASSEELSKTAQNVAEGSQKQAASLEETSSAMEEMTTSVEQISSKTQNQAASVEEVSSSIEEMSSSIRKISELTGNMKTIDGSSKESALMAMKKIEESSNKIKNIISVISDIADQTNLLALNASIEAARAGDAGRGFAVVAKEISKLADKSASATKEIAELITETGKNVNNGVEMVKLVAQATEEQQSASKQIEDSIQNVNQMSQTIASIAEEQSGNTEEVSKKIENINTITQQTASSSEEMASSTEELSGQAEALKKLVAQFKI